MIELASKHNDLGYPMLHGMLKAEQRVVNRKHTYGIYAEEKLQLKNRRKNKLKRPRMPLVVPLGTDIRRSMDFVSDQLSNGRQFRVLSVKDDYSKRKLPLRIHRELVGFSAIIKRRGKPNEKF